MTSNADAYAADSSLAVASIDATHERHDVAFAAVRDRRPAIAGHAAFETYSVLTRWPLPRRLSPDEAALVIGTNFTAACWPAPATAPGFVRRVAGLGIVGGAVYDALVAQAALDNHRTLLTLDRRAARTYDRLGVTYELIG